MSAILRRRLEVAGVVQAVGFRPHVHATATRLGLVGSVRNRAGVVEIDIEGAPEAVARFEQLLRTEPPPLAEIETIVDLEASGAASPYPAFVILDSEDDAPAAGAAVPPDTAPCAACLAEMDDPYDRRFRHPFTSCTHCGPRFTITERVPYDRATTTMAPFPMCAACMAEYANPEDRRHHAQPIACHDCGPRLGFSPAGTPWTGAVEGDDAIAAAQAALSGGAVLAVKGIGGYHLAVDATNADAVAELRRRKRRPDKPLAVMVADLGAARQVATPGPADAAALEDPARPIVLVAAAPDHALAPAVAPGSPLLGLMLPSSPLHHLLFQPVPDGDGPVPRALVMTSGNLSGEPICHRDDEARTRLGPIVDGFLHHDRRIHAPCDDSVVRTVSARTVPLRRSRGWAPRPVRLPFPVEPTLAVGGDIKTVAGVANGRTAWLGQHIGDLADEASLAALESCVDLLTDLIGVTPTTVVADRHPGYRSHRWAQERSGPALRTVDHHHAHAAALMVEHGLGPDERLLTVVFDGTGLGPDDTIWGGEILGAGYGDYDRLAHLRPVPLPGGTAAIENPCRTALAHLRAAGIAWTDDLAPVAACSNTERAAVDALLARATPTSSMGRLFDAIASLLGVRHRISYEAQAAIELEHLASAHRGPSPFVLTFSRDGQGAIDAAPVVREIVRARRDGADAAAIARAFHDAVIGVVVDTVVDLDPPDRRVGLTGGVFQNALLSAGTEAALHERGYTVLTHARVAPNDSSLALGQIAVAAARYRKDAPCV